ncbi:MAG: I78 family peptidase inhibitor [Gemmobacter sp.]
MRLFLIAPALMLAAACTVEPIPEPMPPASPSCGAEGLQGLVGQRASVLQGMAFGSETRIIRPGMAVTMDYRENRLNIEIDTRERIVRVYCG